MRPMLFGFLLAVLVAPQVPGLAQEPAQAPVPAPAPAAPKVQLTFEPGGVVTLMTKDATLRDILAEWTRKGGTPFPGAEKLAGGPQTLEYMHRPEIEVVNSLLRGASGVVVAPREDAPAGASTIAVVYVIATSNATLGGYQAPTYTAQQPQLSTVGSPDQEIPPAGPGRSGEPPQPAAGPTPPAPRPAGVSGVAVPVVGVPTPPTTTPTPTPTPTGGRGRGGGVR